MSRTKRNSFGTEVAVHEAGFRFYHEASQAGVQGLGLSLEVNGRRRPARYTRFGAGRDRLSASGTVGQGPIRCRTEVRLVPKFNAITVQHTLVNTGRQKVRVRSIVTGLQADTDGVRLGRTHGLGLRLRYCHTDNVRTERYPYCQGEYPYLRMLPAQTVHLGTGEDQPFPGIYFVDEHYRHGLVIAATSQDHTLQSWEFRKTAIIQQSVLEVFNIHHELPQTRELILGPGQSLALDGTYYEILEGIHPQDAYVNYVEWLAGRYRFRGQTTALRHQAFYCSWNYGVFSDQYETALLQTARFIRDRMPNIRFFLMDAGYVKRTRGTGSLEANFLDRFYPDPNGQIDAEKFPHGIRHFSRELRQLGLRPGIWWSPTARLDSPLGRDHPDWFLCDRTGRPFRIGEHNGFLDLTKPAAVDFVDRTLAVVLGEWEMDALKMDFWSQNFEDRDGQLAGGNQTAVETRRVLFDLIRKHLPADGVFMTCVAVGMGNPFIGEHADTYRNTMDIGAGVWQEQVDNCVWALPTLGLPGRRTLLLNNDSAGVNLKCPDNENFFRLAWSFTNMGIQEIGGRLEQLPPRYVRAMRKFTDRCDRGHRCLCPDERAFTGVPLPEVLYVDYPPGSRTRRAGICQTVALFNWTDQPRIVSVRRAALGHNGPVTALDFWTERRERLRDEFLSRRLNPRSARLYDILT